jgi:phage I-like protein
MAHDEPMPASPLKLLTLRSPAPQFDVAKGVAGLPTRILVMPWGRNETTQGPVIVNETTVKQLIAFNRSQNWDKAYFDFEHASIPGSPTYQGEPVKIAAPGVSLDEGGVEVVPGEGVYQRTGAYTPVGAEAVAGGNYSDLSPVVKVNEAHEMIGLHSTAFCRHGATTGLIFLSAATVEKTQKTKTNAMPQTAEELLAALREMLKLDTAATPSEVMTQLKAAMESETKTLSKPSENPPGNEEVKKLSGSITQLLTLVQAQGDQIKTLSANHASGERSGIIAAALVAGKQVPAMAKDLPLDQLKLLCAELPVTVPVGERQTASTLMLSGLTQIEDPELAKLDAEMGITAEERQKYLGKKA